MRHLGNACIIWIPSLLSVTVGCYSSRQPSAADTNTSWLDSCAQQSDCTAGYACIAGFCQSDDGTLGTAGTSPDTEAANAGAAAPSPEPNVRAGGGASTPAACGPSLDLEGMIYSPGGDVLPNGCQPFHPTTNNPYAVRCIDAWPDYDTGFPGDESCILPPAPGMGIQIGVHPQGKQWHEEVSQGDLSGYENPDDPFLLEAGAEAEVNYQSSADNPEPVNYYRSYVRVRTGLHHMNVTTNDPMSQRDGTWTAGSPGGLLTGSLLAMARRRDENQPATLDKPAEDEGLYSPLVAAPGIEFNMHHVNPTTEPMLKEVWVNLWWEEDATAELQWVPGVELWQVATLNVAPGETRDVHYVWNITKPTRLVHLTGHRHAWTSNFSVWVESEGNEPEILYQSFDAFDIPAYRYDSLTDNPAPDPEARTDGAASGVRMLQPGEELHFNCHITYTDERAAAIDGPQPDAIGTLRFANEAFTGEMCILTGQTAAIPLPAPVFAPSPVPDFATLD